VQVLENASELKEIGAAVGLGPGVVRILRSWGIEAVEAGAAPVLHINLYTHEGKHIITAPFQAREKAGEDLVSSLHQ
jgi:2-polyprenyl-6-methoxyphenol hydroxylase-like FAD-dependent oxidoreductase